MRINRLLDHLDQFIKGYDNSVQWAKDAETILDEMEDEEGLDELEGIFDDLQDMLSLYRPGGGDHLVDEIEMNMFCKKVISVLTAKK